MVWHLWAKKVKPVFYSSTNITTMNSFEKQVLTILVNEPSIFNAKIKRLGNVKHAHRILNSYLPFRVGIEFEHGETTPSYNTCYGYLNFNYGINSDGCETKVSFRGYKNLIELYRYLNLLSDTVPFNEGSGIHIHIDARSFFENITTNSIPQSIIDYIIRIFNYTGLYNEHRMSIWKQAIRIHSYYTTLEYRIFKMTYNYSELVKWILICSYLNKCVKSNTTIKTSIIDELFAL